VFTGSHQIPVRTGRIGADDEEIGACRHEPVARAGRKKQGIAGRGGESAA
jgi:hypothetical protein